MSSWNPYTNVDFIDFFLLLGQRLLALVSGQDLTLASDELQILVLSFVSASAALVGTFLYLRRMTMLANSLSHTILFGIVIAYVFTRALWFDSGHDHSGHMQLPIGILLVAAVGTGLLTTFLTQFFTRTLRLQEDASMGLVFTSLFALGILLVTILTRNAHIGAEVVMGNVDALHYDDIQLVLIIFLVNALLFYLFFKEFALTTFDPQLALSLGVSTLVFDYLLMTQVSLTAIGAFRAVGVLMVLALIIVPPMTARLLTHRLKTLLFLSIGIGVFASILGVAIARHLLSAYGIALSTAGVVVCLLAVFYFITAISSLMLKKGVKNGRKSTEPSV